MRFNKPTPKTEIIIVLSAIILLALGASFLIAPNHKLSAQEDCSGDRCVGGKVERVIQCCAFPAGGAFIQVSDPEGGTFVYQPPSKNLHGSPTQAGKYVLGKVGFPIQCLDASGNVVGEGPLLTENGQLIHGTSEGGTSCVISSLPSAPRQDQQTEPGQCPLASDTSACSVENLRSTFEGTSCSPETMSRICQRESGANPGLPSGVDKLWHEPGNPSFSYGLFQINIVANDIYCPVGSPHGEFLDCNSAFSEQETISGESRKQFGGTLYGRAGFGFTIENRTLFDQCVAAAKDPACNAETAKRLCQQRGTRPWRCVKGVCQCTIEGT